MNEGVLNKLELRLGRLHARQRLGIETDHEAQIFGQGINFFHLENWYSIHSVIRTTLKLLGLYGRGRRNAEQIQIRHNHVGSKMLPKQFDGFTLLHISDLHVDASEGAMRRLNEILPGMTYDMCVLTGDYRGATFGPFDAALEGLARIRAHLKGASLRSAGKSRFHSHGPRTRRNGNSDIAQRMRANFAWRRSDLLGRH
jgi:uncharacterized protein